MQRPPTLMILVAVLLALASCNGMPLAQADSAWVEAERATFDAVAPELAAYVLEDEDMIPSDKHFWISTVLGSWQLRIEQHETLLGLTPSDPVTLPDPPPLPGEGGDGQ